MIKLNTNEFSKKAQNLLKFSDGETMHLIYKGDKLCLQTRSVTAYVNAENIGEQQAFIPQKAIALINKISSDEFQMEAAGDTLTVKYNRSSVDFQMSKNSFEPNIFEDDMPEMNVINKSLLCSAFGAVALDESSILKNNIGKVRTELIQQFSHTPYKSCWSATPAPNDYMELGNHSEFLGVMGYFEMLATFFVHDGGDVAKWRLKGHAEEAFWDWIASWAAVVPNPSVLGFYDERYTLPELKLEQVTVKSDIENDMGQFMLLPSSVQTLQKRAKARKQFEFSAVVSNAANPNENYSVDPCNVRPVEGWELFIKEKLKQENSRRVFENVKSKMIS